MSESRVDNEDLSIGLMKNFSLWSFIKNLATLDFVEIKSTIKSYKEEIEFNSVNEWDNNFSVLRKYQQDGSNEKIQLTLFIILCSDFSIRVRRFDFSSVDIIFSTDYLITEISDLLSYISDYFNDIICVPNMIFTCIHLGTCGPQIGSYHFLISNRQLPCLLKSWNRFARALKR
ncbi:hypothetical protein MXB_3994 [Myxobolus squamalis]|nr:hypothetical protein MXB_3994 [Myxobolus squamalis]